MRHHRRRSYSVTAAAGWLIVAYTVFASIAFAADAAKLAVRDVGEAIDARHIEIRGVAAGAFDPAIWQAGALHLLPDIRRPVMEPRPGKFRNIYAPSIVEVDGGWNVYYGGWDGVPTGNDRIYLAETRDFLDFVNRRTVIEHNTFQHICNVNVTRAGDRFAMMCTVFPDANGQNKPITFFSPDGVRWNGATAAFPATPQQIVTLEGYENYATANMNGVSVLLFEEGKYRMYFSDFKRFGKIYRASSDDGHAFKVDGAVLDGSVMVNDVEKFRVGGQAWYLMGLHTNGDKLFYSLSKDAMAFPPAQTLCECVDDVDRYIVAIGWATQGAQDDPGRRVLGLLYGAGAEPGLASNRIFARWLQKKIAVTTAGKTVEATAALGPDRQLIPADHAMGGRVELFGEDGKTSLAVVDHADLKPGRVYVIELLP